MVYELLIQMATRTDVGASIDASLSLRRRKRRKAKVCIEGIESKKIESVERGRANLASN